MCEHRYNHMSIHRADELERVKKLCSTSGEQHVCLPLDLARHVCMDVCIDMHIGMCISLFIAVCIALV